MQACAAELGYVVNAVASSMRSQQTCTVGLVMADVSNPWFGQLAGGVESVLGPEGFSVILANTDNSVEREREAVETLLRKQVDALVVASSSADGTHLRGAIARGIKVVLVDADLPDLNVDSISIDNEAVAQVAVEHLLDFGHEDVAIVIGGTEASSDRGRLDGYSKALASRGLRARPECISNGSNTFEGGRAAVAGLLVLPRRPGAIFVTNNLMTVGALVAIADAGLQVPRDVSIVGIDDMEWYPIAHPAITAVFESPQEMGRRAAERLLLRLRRKRQPRAEHIRLAGEFRVRHSAGPPPSDRETPSPTGGDSSAARLPWPDLVVSDAVPGMTNRRPQD
ncbi:MAG: substrate-binding domain-containing protein [Chloroflexota bacterium]|nr:substrate-binding domain-containing protein [Chloroflexota bacterium]